MALPSSGLWFGGEAKPSSDPGEGTLLRGKDATSETHQTFHGDVGP